MELFDNGIAPDAVSGDGIFTITFADGSAGENPAKTTGAAGWGDNEIPSNGDFIYELAAPGNVTMTLDTNAAGDGWLPDSGRVATDVPYLFATVYATGDWVAAAGLGNDWDPTAAAQLTDDGSDPNDTAADGIYTLTAIIPAAASYSWKGLLDAPTALWTRALAAEGFTTAGNNLAFTTSIPAEEVVFEIDTNTFLARATATGVPVELSVFSAD